MAKRRLELQKILSSIEGVKKCYYRPPASLHLKYPCIIYSRDNILQEFADNTTYRGSDRYTVTVIDEDPDSEIPRRVLELPYCSSDREFRTDGLNHFVFTLFY